MSVTNAFPKPAIGDIFVRKNLNGNEEEALIVAIQSGPKAGGLWQAVMMTKNGTEFVTGDQEHRNIHDWRPKGWIHDEQLGNWFSPAQTVKIGEQRAAEAAKAAVEAPEHKDEFLVADASEITNAITKKRAPVVAKLPVPQLPQV
jgi:hypothetical protein